MRIVVTGSEGFIGRNLRVRLRELGHQDMACIGRSHTQEAWAEALHEADVVFHLAGVNRPKKETEFESGNVGATRVLRDTLTQLRRAPHIVYASSSQAELDNPYGRSKRAAENVLFEYGRSSGAVVHVYRLTNVFGKWARPFYNSAVATFCHQAAHGLPITINDPDAVLRLLYIDDVVAEFVTALNSPGRTSGLQQVQPVYETTVGAVAEALRSFVTSRTSLMTPPVGTGLIRALYSTYVSHLPTESFSYVAPRYGDSRGEFIEMLKTPDCGQFSYFTAHPGVTRGEHYHHSKTEKFLVIRGSALFGFRNIDTGATHELEVSGGEGRVVETAPGWAHNITNIGNDELIVMLWANEVFDRERPDTIAMKVAP